MKNAPPTPIKTEPGDIYISKPNRYRIAERGLISERTVSRAYFGEVSEWSWERVARAARELGFPEPPRARVKRAA